jgi:uncharacterized protein (DUF4213/DUF364 family)
MRSVLAETLDIVTAGVRITDPERMATVLRQGGSAFHLFKDCCEKTAFVTSTDYFS